MAKKTCSKCGKKMNRRGRARTCRSCKAMISLVRDPAYQKQLKKARRQVKEGKIVRRYIKRGRFV